MRHGFSRARGRVHLRLDDDESAVLAELLADLASLIEPDEQADHVDPLAALVGIDDEQQRPADPALVRLLPDAYPDDDEASADFRRFTQRSLRERKSRDAAAALGSLLAQPRSGAVMVDPELSRAWLGALNDLRLVIGVRLGVSEDDADPGDLPDDDPRAVGLHLYDWLTWLQSTLLQALGAPDPGQP